MIARHSIVLLSLFAMGILLYGCRRKEVIQTQYTRLLQNWKLVRIANDGNGNGVIDPSEIQPVQEGYDDEIIFHGDSTGNETVITNNLTTTYPFTWTMNAKDTIFRYGIGHDTIQYYLADISSISLELTTNTTLGLAAYYFEKK